VKGVYFHLLFRHLSAVHTISSSANHLQQCTPSPAHITRSVIRQIIDFGSCCKSSCYRLGFDLGSAGLIQGRSMWYSLWTKGQWGSFPLPGIIPPVLGTPPPIVSACYDRPQSYPIDATNCLCLCKFHLRVYLQYQKYDTFASKRTYISK